MEKWRNERIPVTRDGFPRSVTCRSLPFDALAASYTTLIPIQWKKEGGSSPPSLWPRINALFKSTCFFSSSRPLVCPLFRPLPPSLFFPFEVNGSNVEGFRAGRRAKQGAKGGCRYWGALRGISLRTLHCVTSSFIPDFAAGLRGESAKTLRPPPLPLPSSFLHRFRPLCRSTIVHASFSSCSYDAPPLTRLPLETFFFPCENSATNFFIIYIYKLLSLVRIFLSSIF